jgi:hypothetical protein
LIPLEAGITLIPLETDMATTTDELLPDNTDGSLSEELPMIEESAIIVLEDIVDDEDKFYFDEDYLDIYDFSDDCVIVGMKRAYSEVNKVYPDGYFGPLFYKVEDISFAEGDTGSNPLINYEGFHQILKLYLVTSGTESVLIAIRWLEQRDDVLCAEPWFLTLHTPDTTLPPTRDTKSNLPATGDVTSQVFGTVFLATLSFGICLLLRQHSRRTRERVAN